MRGRGVLTLAASLSLLVAGCGDSGEDSTSSSTTTSTTSTSTEAEAPSQAIAGLGVHVAAAPAGEDGVVVVSVYAPGAGIKEGDFITEVDGQTVATVDDLLEGAGENVPGQTISIAVTRDGKTFQLNVLHAITTYLGVEVQKPKDGKGALVVGVQPDSPAKEAGIQEDDLITEVGGEPVDNESLASVVGSFDPGDQVEIKLTRGSEDQDVTATLAENPATK